MLSVRARRFLPHLVGSGRKTLAPDLAGGLTVAALAVPQGLAYALVAGVPPEMGLMAAAIPAIVAALWGSSPYLVTGPTNPIALVVGISIVGPALAEGRGVPIDMVLATGFTAGLLLLGFGFAGVGRASRFLSDSVVVGFATGAGILIALRLLPELGTEPVGFDEAHPLVPRVWPLLVAATRGIVSAEPRALGLALGVPLFALALRRLDPRVPGSLLSLAAAALAVWLFGWDDLVAGAASSWTGGDGFSLRFPPLVESERIAAPALAIALLATLQSVAAARSLPLPRGQRLDPDRELVGQGAANLAASVCGALPTSGSLTRSAVARSAGARSRLAAVASGLAILALLPFGEPLFARIPLSALVGLVALSGFELVNPRALRRAATTRGDAAVLVVTLVATVSIDLVQALYAGLFLSLILLVRRSGRLQMVELVRAGEGRFKEIPLDEHCGETPAVFLHLEGDLNFAVSAELGERLDEIGARGPQILVLRLKRARHLDATMLEALRQSAEDLNRGGTSVVVCGLSDEHARLLQGTELAAALGPDGLLRSGTRLFEGFERALERTRAQLRPMSDDEIFRSEEPSEEFSSWMYEV